MHALEHNWKEKLNLYQYGEYKIGIDLRYYLITY
jgi:hypothetical protein